MREVGLGDMALDEEDPSEDWVALSQSVNSVTVHTPNGPLGSDRPGPTPVQGIEIAKSKKKHSRTAEEEFFADGKPKEKEAFPESKAADQKEVDKVVLGAVKKTEFLAKYLKASWGLSKGEYPHQLKF